MKSSTTLRFWKLYEALPEDVQRRADKAYRIWQLNTRAHGLDFKRAASVAAAELGR